MLQSSYKLSELATLLDAVLHGDPDCVITGVAPLQHAKPQQISFLDNSRYRKHLSMTQASAVILAPTELSLCPTHALVMTNPYLGYAKTAALFDRSPKATAGVHPSAVIEEGSIIHPTASIGAKCVIGSNVVIEEQVVLSPGCVIGEGSRIGSFSHLWANVTIYHGVTIGSRVIIHSGAVIGSDGFGFAQDKGIWKKVPQIGGVIIGNDVEIGANTTIDRGALGNTIIDEGAKLDNQIQIAHNVHIGAHTAVAGCVGIAGSVSIGKHCAIGGGVGIAGHISITDKVMITAGSGIAQSITEPGLYSSSIPAESAAQWKRNLMRIYQLDKFAHRLRNLEKMINKTESCTQEVGE